MIAGRGETERHPVEVVIRRRLLPRPGRAVVLRWVLFGGVIAGAWIYALLHQHPVVMMFVAVVVCPCLQLLRLTRILWVFRRPQKIPLLRELSLVPGSGDGLWRSITLLVTVNNRPGIVAVASLLGMFVAVDFRPSAGDFITLIYYVILFTAYFRWFRLLTYCALAGWRSYGLVILVFVPLGFLIYVQSEFHVVERLINATFSDSLGFLMFFLVFFFVLLTPVEATLWMATPWLRAQTLEKIHDRLF